MGLSRLLACAGVAVCLSSLSACGGEAESRDEPVRSDDAVRALDALRHEVAALRSELRTLTAQSDAAALAGARLAIELVDGGKRDPFLAERSHEMSYIARKWGEDGYDQEIEQRVEALKQRGHVAVPGIIPFLRDVSSDRRLAALNVLREMGVAAELAVPQIKERLKDPDAAVQAAARDALCAIHDM